jgi:integrase
MANLTATLYITVKTKAGKWTTVKPAMSDNGRLKKLVGMVDGKEEKHPEGQYKVRWLENGKPRFDSVGNDPDAALMALNRREKALAAIAAGVEVKSTDGKQRHRISDAAAQYLAFVKENHSHKTWLAYSRNIKLFQESCPKTFLDQIDRADVLEFITACRKQVSPRTGEAVGDRTVHNTFQNVNTFFLQNPLQQVTPESMGFTRDQWKTLWNKTLTYVEQEVREYSEEETKELFDACNDDEWLVWNFFLVTGMREQEVANCAWSDFNPSQGTVSVTKKFNRDLGVEFVPKDYEERTLRLTKDVIVALKKRWKAHSSDYLIFPNVDGKPNGHFLRDLQGLAFRARLNCGHCKARRHKKDVSCKDNAVCGKWGLHEWRKTFACRLHRSGVDARTIQHLLGHSDLETTLRYLRSASQETKDHGDKLEAAFATPKRGKAAKAAK